MYVLDDAAAVEKLQHFELCLKGLHLLFYSKILPLPSSTLLRTYLYLSIKLTTRSTVPNPPARSSLCSQKATAFSRRNVGDDRARLGEHGLLCSDKCGVHGLERRCPGVLPEKKGTRSL
jgi:hypothetical protein